MVKNNEKTLFALSAIFFLSAVFLSIPLQAETKLGAEIALNSGWVHLDSSVLKSNDIWNSSAEGKIKIDTAFSSSIKAYLEGRVNVSYIPSVVNPLTNEETQPYAKTDWSLYKAYMKFRLPFGFTAGNIRIAAGKMPLSWGYGLFYNSGDLIFGSDPLDSLTSINSSSLSFSSSTLNDFRTMTDWIFTVSVPILKGFQTEFVVLPPLENAELYQYGRFGFRTQFNTDLKILENIEAGYLAEGDVSTQKAYISLDGNLWLDYNINSSVKFSKENKFEKDDFELSLALSKIFNIQTDVENHKLQLRAEGLYKPFAEKLGIFGFASYQIIEELSISSTYFFCSLNEENDSFKSNSHYMSLAIVWTPVKSLDISLEGMLNIINPQKLSTVQAGIKYKY